MDSTLLYTRSRDIHCVGVIYLQMLLGLDVVDRFADVRAALQHCAYSVSYSSHLPPYLSLSASISSTSQHHALNMLSPRKNNHVSCLSLLTELSETSLHGKRRSASIAIIGIFCTCMCLSIILTAKYRPEDPSAS